MTNLLSLRYINIHHRPTRPLPLLVSKHVVCELAFLNIHVHISTFENEAQWLITTSTKRYFLKYCYFGITQFTFMEWITIVMILKLTFLKLIYIIRTFPVAVVGQNVTVSPSPRLARAARHEMNNSHVRYHLQSRHETRRGYGTEDTFILLNISVKSRLFCKKTSYQFIKRSLN